MSHRGPFHTHDTRIFQETTYLLKFHKGVILSDLYNSVINIWSEMRHTRLYEQINYCFKPFQCLFCTPLYTWRKSQAFKSLISMIMGGLKRRTNFPRKGALIQTTLIPNSSFQFALLMRYRFFDITSSKLFLSKCKEPKMQGSIRPLPDQPDWWPVRPYHTRSAVNMLFFFEYKNKLLCLI